MEELCVSGVKSKKTRQDLYTQPAPLYDNGIGQFDSAAGIELEMLFNLQEPQILLAPDSQTVPTIDIAALIQQAVSQDPTGNSLNPETLAKLRQAPAHSDEFVI